MAVQSRLLTAPGFHPEITLCLFSLGSLGSSQNYGSRWTKDSLTLLLDHLWIDQVRALALQYLSPTHGHSDTPTFIH